MACKPAFIKENMRTVPESYRIIAIGSAWGKLDEVHSLESKQDFSCGHVFEVSVGLVPLPFAT